MRTAVDKSFQDQKGRIKGYSSAIYLAKTEIGRQWVIDRDTCLASFEHRFSKHSQRIIYGLGRGKIG